MNEIFEIHCFEDRLYVNKSYIKKITNKGRIICNFQPFQGVKLSSINQFNRQYRQSYVRGNHLNMFRCYSLKEKLYENIEKFKIKFKKITGYEINDAIFNKEGEK